MLVCKQLLRLVHKLLGKCLAVVCARYANAQCVPHLSEQPKPVLFAGMSPRAFAVSAQP